MKTRFIGVIGARRLLMFQMLITVSLALSMQYVGIREAISALLGGMVVILPSALFAQHLFHYQGARAAPYIVKRFYFGEGLKLLGSMSLSVMVFTQYNIVPHAFFLTYVTVIMGHWLSPLFFISKPNRLLK